MIADDHMVLKFERCIQFGIENSFKMTTLEILENVYVICDVTYLEWVKQYILTKRSKIWRLDTGGADPETFAI